MGILRRKWSWIKLIEQVKSATKLDPKTKCWNWSGWSNERGYGRIKIDGETWYISRAVLKVKTGKLGVSARHSCDNPPCCNPDHLSWGTQKDNMQDAKDRNRTVTGDAHYSRKTPDKVLRGSKNGAAKLSDKDVSEIRKRYKKGWNISSQTRTRVWCHPKHYR